MDNKKREFTEAYSDYYSLVLSTVYAKVGDMDESRDIAQEIFIVFFNKLDEIENKRKWLYGAIKNYVLKYYNTKKDQVDIDTVFDDAGLLFVNGFRDIRIILQEAIDNENNFMNEQEKILFDLIAINRFTYEQTANQLGLKKRQVRYNYGKIVARIKHYLSSKGINNLEDLL